MTPQTEPAKSTMDEFHSCAEIEHKPMAVVIDLLNFGCLNKVLKQSNPISQLLLLCLLFWPVLASAQEVSADENEVEAEIETESLAEQSARIERLQQTEDIVRSTIENKRLKEENRQNELDQNVLQFLSLQLSPEQQSNDVVKLVFEKKWLEAHQQIPELLQQTGGNDFYWLLKGAISERLEQFYVARSSYEEAHSISKNQKWREAIRARRPLIEKEIELLEQIKWGPLSNGFFASWLPLYRPQFFNELDAETGTAFDVGINVANVFLGYRKQYGTFDQNIQLPKDSTGSPTYGVLTGGGRISQQELYANIHIPLQKPYTDWGPLQLTMPLYIGFVANTVESGNRLYANFGYDIGLGYAVRGYTRSRFSWYAQGLLHVGLLQGGVRKGGMETPIRNAAGDDIRGRIDCLELSVGVMYLLGADTQNAK